MSNVMCRSWLEGIKGHLSLKETCTIKKLRNGHVILILRQGQIWYLIFVSRRDKTNHNLFLRKKPMKVQIWKNFQDLGILSRSWFVTPLYPVFHVYYSLNSWFSPGFKIASEFMFVIQQMDSWSYWSCSQNTLLTSFMQVSYYLLDIFDLYLTEFWFVLSKKII